MCQKFRDQTSVLNHMNQPFSSCRSHYKEQFQQNLAQEVSNPQIFPFQPTHLVFNDFHPPVDQDLSQSAPSPCLAADTVTVDDNNALMDDDSAWLSTKRITEGYRVVEYTGAAHVYSHGPTFMDKFDADEHASVRKKTTLLPFCIPC